MNRHRELGPKRVPWRDNLSFVATFYAILAGMVGAILALAIGDERIRTRWYWPVGLLAFSLFLLVLGFEKISEALDEDDVDKYLAWLLLYNLGTVIMFFGIAVYIDLRFQPSWTLFWIILVLAFAASWKWIHDIGFLLFAGAPKHDAYRQELQGDLEPEKDTDPIMEFYKLFRRLRSK